jgi:hypothetical protein
MTAPSLGTEAGADHEDDTPAQAKQACNHGQNM